MKTNLNDQHITTVGTLALAAGSSSWDWSPVTDEEDYYEISNEDGVIVARVRSPQDAASIVHTHNDEVKKHRVPLANIKKQGLLKRLFKFSKKEASTTRVHSSYVTKDMLMVIGTSKLSTEDKKLLMKLLQERKEEC